MKTATLKRMERSGLGDKIPHDDDNLIEIPPSKKTPIDTDVLEVEPVSKRRPIEKESPINDNLTEQQRKRDEHTTILYQHFVGAQKEQHEFRGKLKYAISNWCLWGVSFLVLACIALSGYTLIYTERQSSDIIALVGAIIPLLTAVVGILGIVTRYVFPEDADKYIAEFVKQIHENDLQNKRENIKSIDE